MARALEKILHDVIGLQDPGVVFASWQITAGKDWFEEIRKNLQGSRVAIVCLTPENRNSPWMHYEAGCVAGDQETRIIPLLLGLDPRDLAGPLVNPQAIAATELGKLFEALAKLGDERFAGSADRLADHRAEFDTALESVRGSQIEDWLDGFADLFARKTFLEPIHRCTNQNWSDRFAGTRETQTALLNRSAEIRRYAQPHVVDIFDELLAELDGYAMDLSGLLLGSARFDLRDDGSLDMPEGIRANCERRRHKIHELVRDCLHPPDAPQLPEARLFRKFESFEYRKTLVKRVERKIRDGKGPNIEGGLVSSPWDYDRIVFHLLSEQRREATHISVRDELERMRSKGESATRMPLHYAVRALRESLECGMPVEDAIGVNEVLAAVANELPRDEKSIRPNIEALQEIGAPRTKN